MSVLFRGAAALTLVVALAGPASAWERNSTVTGPNGQTASRSVTRNQGNVAVTNTGPKGQTMTRNRTYDPTTGTTTGTVTGPNGKSASRTVTRTP